MGCKGLRALALVALLLMPVPASADWAFVALQAAELDSVNDGTMTFSTTATVGNVVMILVAMNNESATVTITGTPNTFTTFGPYDSPAHTMRLYVFCDVITDADDTFTVTTSGAETASSRGAEFTGGTCTQDGTEQRNDDSGVNHVLATDVTVSASNSILMSLLRTDSAASATADTGNGAVRIATSGAFAHASYRILTGAGAFDAPWTTADSETSHLLGIAFLASSPTYGTPCISGGGIIAPGCPGELY